MTKRVILLGLMGVLFLMGAKECTAINCAGGYCRGTNASDFMLGSPNNDKIYGFDSDDIISGNDGRDELHGGKGDDILVETFSPGDIPFPVEQFMQQTADEHAVTMDDLPAGVDLGAQGSETPDVDQFFGGRGDDDINSADGQVDKVDCGPGNDEVIADSFDKLAENCEAPGDSVQRVRVS